MENFDNDASSELLTQLLDGELDSAQEQFLYEELSLSPELQTELKHHLAVREAVRKDTEAFTPPAEAVNAVFNSLGYKVPPNNSLGIIKRSPILLFLWKRAYVPVALLLLGSFAAYYFTSGEDSSINNITDFGNSKVETLADNSAIVPIQDNPIQQINSSHIKKSAVPVMKSIEFAERNAEFDSSILAKSNNDADQSDEVIANEYADLKIFSVLPSAMISSTNSGVNISNSNQINMLPMTASNSNDLLNNRKTVELFVKGFNYTNSESIFAGNLADNFSFGISFLNTGSIQGTFEMGQQSYSILTSSDEEENSLQSANQSVFWYAGAIKYNADFINVYNTIPFVQLSAGSGNFGKFMLRGSVGLEFKPFNSAFGLVLGYESSVLYYSTLGNPYNTSSNGVFMGLRVGL
ncbi:hypothetical protein MASR1M45_03030 [Candidatus Kapaibacterium sp.]